MSEVDYPEWVPESYINAECLWDKFVALHTVKENGNNVDVYINSKGPKKIEWVEYSEYPHDDILAEKICVVFADNSEIQATKRPDGEVMKHMQGITGILTSIRLGGVDEELALGDMGHGTSSATNIGGQDD